MNDLSRRVDVLQGLSPTELDTLQLRCQGKTTVEIAQTQFVTTVEAHETLGHLYDALWLTHLPRERRLAELGHWSDALHDARERQLLADRFRGYVPQPSTGSPPEIALAAVAADDEVIAAWQQSDGVIPVAATASRRRLPPWWPGAVAVVALLLVGGLAFLALRGDDELDTQTIVPTLPVSPSATLTATTPTTTATAVATAIPTTPVGLTSSVASTVPSTPTVTSTATATATAIEIATATVPLPTPLPVIVYEANWSQDFNGWAVGEGWRVENGVLLFDGQGGSRAIWSPTGLPEDERDYIVEAELLVNNGPYTSAVGGFAMRDASDQDNPEGQVATVVSTGGWHTYRLEVHDGAALFSVDGTVVGDFDEARLVSPDQLGIFAVATQIQVRAFRVVTL